MPRDQVRATPRNSALGAVADFLAKSYSPERTQQMQGVAKFLDMPSVSETLNRLSYGEPLTTGAGGLGGTTRFRPEVLDAAMAVAPGAGALGKLAAQGTMAVGRAGARLADRAVPRIMERGGMGAEMLQGMSRNTVSPMDVYRVLNESVKGPQSEALRLAQQRAALPPSKGGLGLPANNTPQQRARAMDFEERGFHETEGANIENGLTNFDVRRAGAAASDEQTPYAMFIKPHPAGLGIAKNNPAQMPLMVKSNLTDENIMRSFANRDELQQYLNQFPHIKQSTKAVRDLDNQMADYMDELSKKMDKLYAEGKTIEADSIDNSMTSGSPLMKAFDARMHELAATSKEQITDLFKSQGVGTVGLRDDAGALGRNTITEMVLDPNDNVRSRFAAFDPFRRTAAVAAAMGVAAPNLMAKEIEDPTNQPPEYQSGGVVKLLQNMLVKSGEKAITAAQRAEAGRAAAALIKSQEQVKASEALGQLMEKGFKQTTTTQADRTRVGGGNIGGAPFPALSQADPAYAGKVWGVMDESTASRLKNLTTPDTAWTTMLGSAIQLKTNPVVFDKLKRGFIDSMKQGNLSDELAEKINHNLSLTFGKGADIRDPGIWKLADTFDKRAALADAMMGQGIAPGLGGVALGGEKSGRGVIFRPTDTLIRETEPYLLPVEFGGNVPTYAAGPRLFSLERESMYRPDLHPGFPTLIKGEDLGVNMAPTPTEVYLPDWHARFKAKNPERKAPGYYDLALGVKGEGLPSQELNDAYIQHLLREGFAEGGAVHMGIGGLLKLKNAVKGAQKVLPAAKKDANLAKMLEVSKVKERLYHGTMAHDDYAEKAGQAFQQFTSKPTWLAKEPYTANGYVGKAGSVYPVHAQVKNPLTLNFDANDEASKAFPIAKRFGVDIDHMVSMQKPEYAWQVINDPAFVDAVETAGHDGLLINEGGYKTYGVFDPRKIKSAISNRGTYDITEPDISKAKGGGVHFDEGGAAFGVFPQMKARRAQQDRTAAANAPLSALRGWAAGTAGLPGDIKGLARAGISQLPPQLLTAFPALRAFGIGSRADPTPQLPTTEFYNEYLPGAQLNATPTGKAFTTAGNLLGGTGSTTLARYGIKSAKATAKAIAEAAPGPAYGSRAAQLGVIKMPGGNFLKGEVEDAVGQIKNNRADEANYMKFVKTQNELGDDFRNWVSNKIEQDPNFFKMPAIDTANMFLRENKQPLLPLDQINTFIDKKIVPYIKSEMATPGDPLRAMAEKYAVDKPAKLAEVQGRIDAFAAKMEQTARERGVPVEQLTSMRQQMIGLEKEKALVEAREGLHFTPDDESFVSHKFSNRDKAGTSPGGMGQSPLARSWEDVSDSAFSIETTGDILRFKDSFAPWLSKVPPETKVYRPRGEIMGRTGFNHLIDELRNAINPESGLPANLLIDPADLGKLTMPQAVDRVADINAWRATQRIEANQAIANNAATQVVKEYPEQGLKWVELNQPKAVLEEGHAPGPVSGYPDMHGIIDQRTGQSVSLGATPEEALGLYKRQERYKTLEDALKYEGDTMQHCVGGYCPDVAEGRSRIYSLRDSKGQPRVTIEVEPNQTPYPVSGEAFARLSPAEKAQFREYVMQWRRRNPDVEELTDKHTAQALQEAGVPPQPDRITQIKGFRNKKPADEYLPMVQDFVKSGNWSEVNDLKNSGLRRVTDAFNENELKKIQGAGIEVPTWATPGEIKTIGDSVWPGQYGTPPGGIPEGFAQGGLVSNHFDPIKIKQIIAGLDDEYDPENIQQIIAQRESAYAT